MGARALRQPHHTCERQFFIGCPSAEYNSRLALFPPTFIDDLKAQTDIVTVIGEVTPLKKAGATYKGLCTFHGEKTPSFNVNRDKGFFHGRGGAAGGDVVKFIEMHEKLTFPEAVRSLANRIGMAIPEPEGGSDDRVASAEREALVKLHETAAAFFSALARLAARARRELRGSSGAETIAQFG